MKRALQGWQELSKVKYVVAKASREVAPHEIRIGRRLCRTTGLREGDIVEATTPRAMLFWVREDGESSSAKVSEHVFRLLGVSREYLLGLEKVTVSEADFVVLEASEYVSIDRRGLRFLKTQLHLVPFRIGSYVIGMIPNKGVVAFKVKRAHPRRAFITLNTSLHLSLG